ncbi:MAG: U32 family peptidase [Muribaculaceae bacterium]|nr:U32 family peptidase [Muribaculaceae bacterium]
MRKLELLSPAANKEVAREAILHGADAVYMGASSHGARRKAANSIEDIAWTVAFAHQYRAKVYVTVNTLVYEEEINDVERLVRELYRVGVDALIVQDMSLLRMNLPPIQLHASTQCDTRSVEKAEFLENVGFSQLVLARELSLTEIKEICERVTVPVECFIHGALCVSYSGRCQASERCLGRSANRGECGQMCRMPYTLKNGKGEIILKDKYLLSLADFNASEHIEELIEAGVSSFKIEGRLKDADYVKNVTAAYRKIIDEIIRAYPDKYCRSSFGRSEISFTPALDKSFNRGFTDYFLNGSGSRKMASFITPKSLGEKIISISQLNNGDGISFYNKTTGAYDGVRVNKIENGKIRSAKGIKIPVDAEIRRTYDVEWQKALSGETAERKIKLDISIDETGITAIDERGIRVILPLNVEKMVARKPMEIRHIFEKLGGTIYSLEDFNNNLLPETFIPASILTQLRRDLVKKLDEANEAVYPFEYRRKEDESTMYPSDALDSRDNVANSLADSFYRQHGVKKIEKAMEVKSASELKGKEGIVMTTRYCLRRELGCCKKSPVNKKLFGRLSEPLTIATGPNVFRLDFDCKRCEMNVMHQG